MARRATSPSKKQTTLPGPVGAEASRRGRKAKSTISEPTEPSLIDLAFPGGEEPMETGAEVGSGQPAKARRRRKPKAQPDEQAPTSMAADADVQAEAGPPEVSPNSGELPYLQTDSNTSPSAPPLKARRRPNTHEEGQPEASRHTAATSQPVRQAAATWDADTGTATFDWPSIEQVAAADGPNQVMAKLLLAARAEGANSRWPF